MFFYIFFTRVILFRTILRGETNILKENMACVAFLENRSSN